MSYLDFFNLINKEVKKISFTNHESESRKIFEHITGFSINEVFFRANQNPNNQKLNNIIKKRKTGIPLAYILGYEYFFGYSFIVDNSVLIPRPDSEILVEQAILHSKSSDKLVDLCSGSGCLGISVAKNIALSNVLFVDISSQAIKICKQNALNIGVKANFLLQDVLNIPETSKIIDNYDIVISNPPYIDAETFNNLEPQVKNFEPKIALTDNKDGLMFYRAIVDAVFMSPKKPKVILFEIGFNQAEDVLKICQKITTFSISIVKDLADRDRVVVLKNIYC